MSSAKIFSLEAFKQADPKFRFVEVEAYGGTFRLRSLDSADMIEWIEYDNADADKRRATGLRLAVRSLVDAEGNKVPGWTKEEPAGQREEFFRLFISRDSDENAKIIAAAFEVNGMRRKPARPGATTETNAIDDAKNESGGANSGNSPSA